MRIPPPLVKQTIKNRKKITLNNGKYRCCFLMPNGKRCSRNAVGTVTFKGKKRFFINCPQHFKICTKRYIAYKLACSKVFTNLNNLKRCKTYNSKRRKTALSYINKCINGRVEYPRRCTYGCLRFPGSKKSKNLLVKHDKKHEHVLNRLKTCKKNLN